MATTNSIVQLEPTEFGEIDVLREEGQRNEEVTASPQTSTYSVREILKNSWVKRLPMVEKKPGRFGKVPKPEKVWMVFCIHNNKEPYLEFYDSRRSAYSHNPIVSILLINCLHISPSILPQDDDDFEFVITLDTQVIRIAAASRDQMIEWMDTMKVKLREMGILEPKDNIYSEEPGPIARDEETVTTHPEAQTSVHNELRHQARNPSSPLPPIPSHNFRRQSLDHSVVTSTNSISSIGRVDTPTVSSPSPSTERQDSQDASSDVFNFDFVTDSLQEGAVQNEVSESPEVLPDSFHSHGTTITNRAVSLPTSPSATENSSFYEPLFFVATSDSPSPRITLRGFRNPNYDNALAPQQRRSDSEYLPYGSVATSNSIASRNTVQTNSNEHVIARRQRTLSDSVSVSEPSLNVPCSLSNSNLPSLRTSISHIRSSRIQYPVSNFRGSCEHPRRISPLRAPPPLEEGPPPYDGAAPPSQTGQHRANHGSSCESPQCDENGRQLSLKEAQVMKLQREITHESGVRLTLRKKDSINAIALVECFGSIWIAGWKQKEHPLLHNTFHIGDRIVSIAGHKVGNVQEAQKVIKHQALIVEFIVNRVPFGRVLAIKRQCDGQDLGIVRDGNTAEIKEVDPEGLAALHGLPPKSQTVDGRSLCNWVLTEINHRPLNLFFKDNEILDRLNAVGRDISILVQPSDLIKQLKKQLKLLRGYKDYIVQ